MTDPDDPSRLFESPSAPAGLRDVLRTASNDVGTDAQVARLAQRLGPLLGPVGPALPAAAGKALGLKLALAGAALIVAGGGAWLLASSPSARPPSAPTKSPVSSSAKPDSGAINTTPAAPVAPAPVASVAEPTVAEPEPAPAASPAKLPGKPTPPAQPSEAELLEQARSALKGDPARALQRANEHAARFPRGVLVQEREVLAIQALRKLGRSAEADRRSEAFAKAFPGSAFARKLAVPP
jgi:hypothetical protein